MPEDATQEGVSTMTQREKDMAALTKKRNERNAEAPPEEIPSILPPQEEEPEETPPKEDDPPKVAMVTFYGDDGKEYQVPETAAARLKIDGEEIDEPLTKVTSRYQKGAAGDRRLQEANQLRQELEKKEKALAQRGQELTKKQQDFLKQVNQAKAQKAQGNPSQDGFNKEVKRLANALVDADEERTAAGLSKILAGRQQPAPAQPKVDPKAIEKVVDQRVQATLQKREQDKRAAEQKKAVDWFYENHADMVEDENLFAAVDRQTAQILKEKPQSRPMEVMQEATKRVKAWIDGKAGAKSSKKPKRTTPTPASGRASIGKDDPPPQTRQERLNAMRIARGQPPV